MRIGLFDSKDELSLGVEGGDNTLSWQEGLESFLDPMTLQVKWQIPPRNLLNANEKIKNNVQLAAKGDYLITSQR